MIRRIRWAVALVAAVLATPLAAQQGEVFSSFAGQRYADVRRKLVAFGYRPTRVPNRDISDNCPGFSSCAAYPEVANCSGVGIALCESSFFNRRTGKYLKIVSYGESDKLIDGIYRATNLDLREWGIKH